MTQRFAQHTAAGRASGYSLVSTGHKRVGEYSLCTTGHRRLLARPAEHSLLTAVHRTGPAHSLVSTTCPKPDRAAVVRQVFDPGELERAWGESATGAIVHHGPGIELPGF